jgi:hypothetical protein
VKIIISPSKNKNRRQQYGTPSSAGLLVLAFLFLPHLSFSQEEKKNIPDGTEGEVLQAGSDDYLKKKIN